MRLRLRSSLRTPLRTTPDRTPLAVPKLVVPAYFRPDVRPDDWEQLAKHADQVRLVILNVANGPGTEPDPAFYPALNRLREAGIAVAGYVDTDYGRRSGHEALADLGLFLQWYDVAGVCFDRVSVSAEHLGYYAALSRHAKDMGAHVVMFNHGAHPLEAYAEHADVLGTLGAPGAPTSSWPCRAGRAPGRPTSSTTSCTRCRPSTMTMRSCWLSGAARAVRISPTAAGSIPMTACPLQAWSRCRRGCVKDGRLLGLMQQCR